MKAPLVFEIKANSLDDGPGVRSVVFFKGCPLSCVWCHNPEGMRLGIELSFEGPECVGCDACLSACMPGALGRSLPGFIDRARCSLCLACVEVCPSGALSQVGQDLSVNAICEKVLRDKPFFDTSGGGVTLSGGEPTLHMEFASELLQALKARGVHCLLETCGQFRWERFTELAYPWLDVIYFDLKLMDDDAHLRFCGTSNRNILENFTKLKELTDKDGKELLTRIPLVPGITDTDENLGAAAEFLHGLGVCRARLLPYNPLWPDKSIKVGAAPLGMEPAMKQWMPAIRVQACEAIFEARGIAVKK